MQPDIPRCGAKTRSGGRCQKEAGWGTPSLGFGRCRLHGGASPSGQKFAVQLEAQAQARVMGIAIETDPHEALAYCVAVAVGEVNWLDGKIAELTEAEALGRPTIVTRRRLRLEGEDVEEQDGEVVETRVLTPVLHAWIQARHAALDRLQRYASAAASAGVDERLVRINEQQAVVFVRAIRGALAELGVPDTPEARAVVRRHLEQAAGAIEIAPSGPPTPWGIPRTSTTGSVNGAGRPPQGEAA